MGMGGTRFSSTQEYDTFGMLTDELIPLLNSSNYDNHSTHWNKRLHTNCKVKKLFQKANELTKKKLW